jgi:hypothetical protein
MNWAERVKKRMTDTVIQESLRVAARDVLPEMAIRVFDKGQNGEGKEIGQYSTKPIYISKKATPKIVGGRQTPKSIFYAGGYREFKGAIGRGTKVNLKLFGRFQQAFLSMGEKLSGKSITLILKDKLDIDKKDGNVDRYGDMFEMTKSELARTTRTFNFEFSRRIFEQ